MKQEKQLKERSTWFRIDEKTWAKFRAQLFKKNLPVSRWLIQQIEKEIAD